MAWHSRKVTGFTDNIHDHGTVPFKSPNMHNTRRLKLKQLNGIQPFYYSRSCFSSCGMSKCLPVSTKVVFIDAKQAKLASCSEGWTNIRHGKIVAIDEAVCCVFTTGNLYWTEKVWCKSKLSILIWAKLSGHLTASAYCHTNREWNVLKQTWIGKDVSKNCMSDFCLMLHCFPTLRDQQ